MMMENRLDDDEKTVGIFRVYIIFFRELITLQVSSPRLVKIYNTDLYARGIIGSESVER